MYVIKICFTDSMIKSAFDLLFKFKFTKKDSRNNKPYFIPSL